MLLSVQLDRRRTPIPSLLTTYPRSHALPTGAVDAATGHCMARSRSDRLVGPIHVLPPSKRARIAPAWPRPNTLPS